MAKKITFDNENTKSDERMVRISVRALVEFLLREGDLTTAGDGAQKREAMLLGQKVHKKLQKEAGGDYESEVVFSEDVAFDSLTLRIEGRADGVFTGERRSIDEIKGMYRDPATLETPLTLHLAQAKCYAAMLVEKEMLDEVDVRISYVHFESGRKRFFTETYTAEELRTWFFELVKAYEKWARFQIEWIALRNESIKALSFPYPYRAGQKELVSQVFRSIEDGEQLFLMAPTGVGKTLAVLYPSLQALHICGAERIFYLTAKNQTRQVAEEAVEILMAHGLRLKSVTLTAKEKICPRHEVDCNPESCPYAKGHFDRINDALFETLRTSDAFNAESIKKAADQFVVCPFELGLELSSFADLINGDYNYAFDPSARLRRFFGEGIKSDAVLLIDEAHNLIDRARMMFSAELIKEDVLKAKHQLPEDEKAAIKALDKVNKELLAIRKRCDGPTVLDDIDALSFAVLHALAELDELLHDETKEVPEGLSDFSFTLRDFAAAIERMGEDYIIYGETDAEKHFHLRLFCVDPSRLLSDIFMRARAAVLFSATLLPVHYYKALLGTADEMMQRAVYAPSPFDPAKRKIAIVKDTTTIYKRRGAEMYRKIARAIYETAAAKKGNYIAFFPSYRFLEDVLKIYRKEFDSDEINWVAQSRYMAEEDREIFLENFAENGRDTLIAFCVMGGAFAEGIDLTGERLIGTIIAGTGLPQVDTENEMVAAYFEERETGCGFAYAYLYPGMNKVLQAAGRVIRTEEDRGVVVLLDERFLRRDTKNLFPREWENLAVCESTDLGDVLKDFWDR